MTTDYPILIGSLVFAASIYIGIIVHEFGHLFCGLLSGYTFSSFRVGPFILYRENGRLIFDISSGAGSGQCLMAPPKDPAEFKFILYNMGGVLFNFLFALIMFIFAPGGFFYITALVNFLLGLINIIPIRSFLLNDGCNLLEAMKSKEAAQGLYLVLYANSETMKGKRYRDFDDDVFITGEEADLGNYFVAYKFIYEAARLEDMGRYDEFVELYTRLDLAPLPALISSLVKADLLYYYSFYNPDYEKARELYKDGKLRSLLRLKFPGLFRILAAYYFFVDGNKEKAVKLMKKAKKSAAKFPSKGIRTMETEYIQELIEKAKEAHYAR